jgi:linoleoyl-CoA desaturase
MINEAWAEKQVTTTSNFATRSIVAFFLLGGLNFQIEHHLFPKISHIHYRKLSSIVREVCADHGIMYSKMTFFAAIGSHFRMLKLCGRN